MLYRNIDGTFEDAEKKETQHYKNRQSSLFFVIWAFFLGVVIVLGWLGDLMLGSNSLDQVIFGTSISIGFTLTWYLLRDELTMFFL